MNSEKQKLLQDLLDEQSDGRRQATLMAGGRLLRQRRWRRTAGRSAVGAAAILVLAGLLHWQAAPPKPVLSATQAVTPEPPVKGLTDSELLALFPDTAVGLITLENGTKRLIFPRPGDETRYVKRL